MRKRLLPLLLGILLLLSVTPPAPAWADDPASFPDLKGHWAEATVMQAVAAGFVSGYPDGTFQPDRPITRAEYVKMLVTAGHLPTGGWVPPFADTQNHWLQTKGYLNRAMSAGVITPFDYQTNLLNPDATIPRQEMAVLAERMLGRVAWAQALAGVDLDFADKAGITDWARGYIRLAANDDHIVSGYPDGTFRPDRGATRAEAVSIIQRTVTTMTQGVDPNLHLTVNGKDVTPVVPLAVRDGYVYAPADSVYGARGVHGYLTLGARSDLTYSLHPSNAAYRYSALRIDAEVGGNAWQFYAHENDPKPLLHGQTMAATYMLDGALMIPVAPTGGSGHWAFLDAVHDTHGSTPTLRVTLTPDWPGNTLPTTPAAARLAFIWPPPDNITNFTLVPLKVVDVAGNDLIPAQPPVPHYHVDANSPLRLRSSGSSDLVTDLDSSGYVQLLDPNHIPEGTYTIICSAPGYLPLTWTLHLHDNRPAQVTIDPIATVAVGQTQTITLRILDHSGQPALITPAVRPQVTVQLPDGSTADATVPIQPQAFGTATVFWWGGVATAQYTPRLPGTYHFTVTVPATDTYPQLQATADATVVGP